MGDPDTIYEMPIYCGAMKVWRVLNLSTGTAYSNEFVSEEEASKSIKDGEVRSGRVVKRTSLQQIAMLLNFYKKEI